MRVVPLLVQALAVAIVVIGPKGRARFDGLGVQFVVIAAVYHGLTEALQYVFPQANFYRDFLYNDELDSWLWLVSGSLLAFALAYVASSRLSTRSVRLAASNAVSLGTPWFWLVVSVPIYVYSIFGVSDVDSYWAGGLAQQFLLLKYSSNLSRLGPGRSVTCSNDSDSDRCGVASREPAECDLISDHVVDGAIRHRQATSIP